MKTCYLDANLLTFLGNKSSPFYQKALDIVDGLIKKEYGLVFSSLTLDEYFHAVIRFSLDTKPQTHQNLKKEYKKLLKLNIKLINPSLEEKKHLKVIDLMAKFNLHPRDAYHLFIMLENKVKFMATFDNDFDKVFLSGKIKKFDPAPTGEK